MRGEDARTPWLIGLALAVAVIAIGVVLFTQRTHTPAGFWAPPSDDDNVVATGSEIDMPPEVQEKIERKKVVYEEDGALEMELDRREGEGAVQSDDDDSAEEDETEYASGEKTLWPVDKDGINEAVWESIGGIKECYEQWLEAEPDLSGKVVVSFTIESQGEAPAKITSAEVAETEMEHAFMEGCVLNVVDEYEFEPLPDGETVEVTYPFKFSSE